MKTKDDEKKYRFRMITNLLTRNGEYHVFESRYYAQKYLNEVIKFKNINFEVYEGEEYVIEKVIDGFVIVKVDKHVI